VKLFFASHNLDKKKEIGYILSSSNFEVLYINDFPLYSDVDETGLTLRDNSLLKAEAGFDFTKLPTFAEDTGLEVDALKGEPGVFTSRYAGERATYDDNCRLLLKNMENIPEKERTASFKTVLAFKEKGEVYFFEGTCKGRIAKEKSGAGGFGYDPVFIPEGYNETFAEIDREIKNRISHRALAVNKFCEFLKIHFGA